MKLMLSQQDSIVFVNPNDIIFCKSDNCYTMVYISGGQKVLVVKSLTKIHKELPAEFIRINQSYIINKQHINGVDKKKRVVRLSGDTYQVPFTISLKDLITLISCDNFIIRQAVLEV